MAGIEERGKILSSDRSRESSVRGQVYRLLLRDIVHCELKPGQSLSEKEVAAALGVSRTPVREAFLQLASEALIDISPQRGTTVARISTRQVRQAQFSREVLERAVLAVASRQAGTGGPAGTGGQAAGGRGGLDAALFAQRQAAENGDHAAFYDADELFHAELARLSGFDGTGRLAGGARVHLNRVRWLSLPEFQNIDSVIGEHEAIASAVAAGDAERGDQVLTAHLRNVLADLPVIRERFPGYFDAGDDGLPVLPDTTGLMIGWRAG